MANLVRARSWGQTMPAAGVGIDWGHPLARSLNICVLANNPGGRAYEMVQGQLSTAGGGGWGWRPNGLYTATSGAYEQFSHPRYVLGTSGARTVLVGVFNVTNTGDNRFAVSGAPAGGDWIIRTTGTTTFDPLSKPGSFFGYQQTGATIPTLPTGGNLRQLGFTHNAALYNEYTDGILGSTAAASGTPTASDTGFCIGGSGVNPSSGVSFLYGWNRALSAAEMMWLRAEPYAMFAPPGPKVLYTGFNSTTAAASTYDERNYPRGIARGITRGVA